MAAAGPYWRNHSSACGPRAATARALFTLRLFKRFCDSAGVDEIIATATSAVRESKNGEDLVRRADREAGIHLEVISGSEEGQPYGVNGIGRGYMPGFGGLLSRDDIDLLTQYLMGDTLGGPDLTEGGS